MSDSDDPQISCPGCGISVPPCGASYFNGLQYCGTCAVVQQQNDEERRDTKECPQCYSKTRNWGRKQWRDGREYCKGCAKEKEKVWFIGNSCMLCQKLMGEQERKVKPPERLQQQDPYVKAFVVPERSVCWECYETATRRPFGVRVGKVVKDKRTSTRIGWGMLRGIGRLLGGIRRSVELKGAEPPAVSRRGG